MTYLDIIHLYFDFLNLTNSNQNNDLKPWKTGETEPDVLTTNITLTTTTASTTTTTTTTYPSASSTRNLYTTATPTTQQLAASSTTMTTTTTITTTTLIPTEQEPQETAVLVFSSFRSSNKPMVLDIDGKLKNLRGLPAIKYFFMKDHMMTICCSNLAKTRIRIMVAL